MHLSTSSSENRRRYILGIGAFVGLCLLVVAATELGARTVVNRISAVQRGFDDEYRAALGLGRPGRAAKKSVLVVGNSLLRTGLTFDRVQRAMAPKYDARRLIVDDTRYYDWYFGLRRLFAE